MPAKAGIQMVRDQTGQKNWIPASAGMTKSEDFNGQIRDCSCLVSN